MWALRKAVPVSQWDIWGHHIAMGRHDPKDDPPNTEWLHLLPELRQNGFLNLPLKVGTSSLIEWFDPLYAGPGPHIYSGPNPYFRSYPSGYVVRCPLLLALFNDRRLLGLIEAYMECWPTLYSMNVWWSDPAPKPQLDHMQRFHRDRDDWRFLTVFVYGTDVGEDDGPHQIILGSHRFDETGSGAQFDAHCEGKYGERIHTVTGPAGTVFISNTVGLHRGKPPKAKARMIAWGRFGLGPNVNSFDLEQGPIAARVMSYKPKDTPKARYINRLLLAYDQGPFLE